MKYVTQTTETRINRMVKRNHIYAEELQYLLNTLKGKIGCSGATIKEIESWNDHIDNADQINVVVTPRLRGMGITFEQYITVIDCLDLHYVNILDFNSLVKACYDGE